MVSVAWRRVSLPQEFPGARIHLGLFRRARSGDWRGCGSPRPCRDTHGRDDATALGLAGFVIAIVEHDRRTAIEAFEAALALSPSCSIALILGSIAMGWANEAELALEWGERALRLSPFDPLIFGAHTGLAVGYFASGCYEEAVNAARRAIQSNPGFSVAHWVLAASLAGLGRIPEAKVATARVLALAPNFTTAGTCAGIGVPATLAAPFTEACRAAGLP
jgi:adenylate cyclase